MRLRSDEGRCLITSATGHGKQCRFGVNSEMALKRKHMEKTSPIATVTETVILVTREGEWLPPEELRAIALSAVDTDGNLTVNLEGVEHLDGSALQMLLALAAERKKRGKGLRLANASLALSRWFEYAGGGRTSLLNMSVNGHA
jgi:anti-anti-sigma regulatory factor